MVGRLRRGVTLANQGSNLGRSVSGNVVTVLNPTMTNEALVSWSRLLLDNTYKDPAKMRLDTYGVQFNGAFPNASRRFQMLSQRAIRTVEQVIHTRSVFETPLGFIKPELPTLVPEPPTGEGWIHEIKYDGYRTLIVIDRGQVRAFTRNGNDWTRAYRRVVDACAKLACETALIDGEMVVQDEHGITDFNALRSAIYTAPHRLVLFAFDLLHLDGQDLRGQPLMERRALLRKLIKPDPRSPIQFSDHLEGDGARFFKAAAELGLEGIVSKRAASRYRSGPSRSWLKTKNMVESEFILLGTERDSRRRALGAVGIGSGWSA